MGWGSAVDIMDTALRATETAVKTALAIHTDLDGEDVEKLREAYQPHVDEILRPFVSALAEKLRDGDWDTQEDSDYFERFPREMLGHDAREHREWLVQKVYDTNGAPHWVKRLADFTEQEGQAG